LKRDQFFVGDLNTLYKSGNVTVDVKVNTDSNVRNRDFFFPSNIIPFIYDNIGTRSATYLNILISDFCNFIKIKTGSVMYGDLN